MAEHRFRPLLRSPQRHGEPTTLSRSRLPNILAKLLGSVRSRIGAGFAAQGYNQAASIAIQLVSIPTLLHAWGVEVLGVWVTLTAIPTYLSLTDFGFSQVAANEMTICIAAANRERATAIFQSVLLLLIVLSVTLIGVIWAILYAVPLEHLIDLGSVRPNTGKAVIAALGANVIAGQFFVLFTAGYRAENKFAIMVLWIANTRVAEAAVLLGLALLTTEVVPSALGIAAVRLVAAVAVLFIVRRKTATWLRVGFRNVSLHELRQLTAPSLAYMLIPFANALINQGPVIILSTLGSAVQVAVFSTSRSFTRIGFSAIYVLNTTLQPEYSKMYGENDRAKINYLYKTHVVSGVALSIVYLVLMIPAKSLLFPLYTRGSINLGLPLFATLLAAVALEMVWSSFFTPVIALNKHPRSAVSLVGITILGTLVGVELIRSFGVTGAGIALMLTHVVICLVVGRTAAQCVVGIPNAPVSAEERERYNVALDRGMRHPVSR